MTPREMDVAGWLTRCVPRSSRALDANEPAQELHGQAGAQLPTEKLDAGPA